MRQFHIPLVIISVVSFSFLIILLFFQSPFKENTRIINWSTVFIFLFLVVIFVTATLSLLLFFAKRFLGLQYDERLATRLCIRQGFWVGLGLSILGVLHIIKTLNIITLSLTVATLFLFEIALRENNS